MHKFNLLFLFFYALPYKYNLTLFRNDFNQFFAEKAIPSDLPEAVRYGLLFCEALPEAVLPAEEETEEAEPAAEEAEEDAEEPAE